MPQPPDITAIQTTPRCAWRLVLLALALAASSACTSVGFYTQALAGQLEIWRLQRPIDVVLKQNTLSEGTRRKLQLVKAARAFAHTRMALPDNGSYRDYVELGRDYVVWNVFAAGALTLVPEQSCFVLVGCLSYRGYFSPQAAQAHAERLREAGYDVYVGGVSAYSTLGWFDDPVLSTTLAYDDLRLVEILFHELAHQQLYVKNDTTFNESFAVAIAAAGLEAWLTTSGQSPGAAQAAQGREHELMALLMDTRKALERLYASAAPGAEKHAEKARLFADLSARYADLKAAWGGNDEYDRWMAEPWNNAKMSSIATYNDYVPAFRALLASVDGDFSRAYRHAAALAGLEPTARRRCLENYLEPDPSARCPAPSRTATARATALGVGRTDPMSGD